VIDCARLYSGSQDDVEQSSDGHPGGQADNGPSRRSREHTGSDRGDDDQAPSWGQVLTWPRAVWILSWAKMVYSCHSDCSLLARESGSGLSYWWPPGDAASGGHLFVNLF
jgi:hypothetical protein